MMTTMMVMATHSKAGRAHGTRSLRTAEQGLAFLRRGAAPIAAAAGEQDNGDERDDAGDEPATQARVPAPRPATITAEPAATGPPMQ